MTLLFSTHTHTKPSFSSDELQGGRPLPLKGQEGGQYPKAPTDPRLASC